MQPRHHLRFAARIVSIIISVASTSMAQEPAARGVIDAVEVTGNTRTTDAFVLSAVQLTAGDPVDQAAIDQDIRLLLQTSRFLTVNAEVIQRDGQNVLVFDVADRSVVADIRFVGNLQIKDKDLYEHVPLQAGDPVDGFRAREGIDNILAAYREKGYSNVLVDFDAELFRQSGELAYTIEEGPKLRIREIRFEGNQSIPEDKLKLEIVSATYMFIFRDGAFDANQAEQDAAAIQTYYRGEGFLDAQASYRVEPGEQPDDLELIFLIAEGDQYAVESVSIEGNAVFTTEQIQAELRVRQGKVIRRMELDRDIRDIQERYGRIGHIYAQVKSIPVFAEAPGLVRIKFEIQEGEAYRVGRIVPRGNETTKDKVVRRALLLYPPDDLINLDELKEAEQRLRETQIFGFAKIKVAGNQPGVRDLVIDVEESDRAGDFIIGVGVNSDSGAVGNLVLDIKNFDLYDTPRNFTEFINGRSFRGAGQRLRLEAQPGTELTRLRIDFSDPYFLDKPMRFGTSAYFFERERESYDETRIGFNVSLGKRLKQGLLKDWYAEVALRAETVKLDELELFAPRDVRDDEGSTFLTSAKFTLARDRTDSRFVPTSGDLLRLSWEQFGALGGDEFLGKFLTSYTWHRTVFEDREERKHVISLRGDVGAILGNAPVFERFYAGGIGSIRGFEFRGVSPRKGLEKDPVGGEFMALLRAEYSFPLYADNLRGLFFTDMGTVEEDFSLSKWRASVGFGVRMTVEFFGPIPLEFDLALPVASEEDDEEQVFSFFIGAIF